MESGAIHNTTPDEGVSYRKISLLTYHQALRYYYFLIFLLPFFAIDKKNSRFGVIC